MKTFNIRSFRQVVRHNKRRIRIFLSRLERRSPRGLEAVRKATDLNVWKEMDCLECANCCKTMSPTYTPTDVARISNHLGMSSREFRKKWLYKDSNGDWLNVKQPCQFLDLDTNKCSIYAVRPKDCAGFPHHNKKRMVDYMHVYKQNIEYCPATYRLVKKMMEDMQEPVAR